eukprot:COSAG02_NODE_39950_length_411_cov_0.487179_1_plen_114_part_10
MIAEVFPSTDDPAMQAIAGPSKVARRQRFQMCWDGAVGGLDTPEHISSMLVAALWVKTPHAPCWRAGQGQMLADALAQTLGWGNKRGVGTYFFKQKTAYGIRIRDWSSDVCSSD